MTYPLRRCRSSRYRRHRGRHTYTDIGLKHHRLGYCSPACMDNALLTIPRELLHRQQEMAF